jgi:ABC-type glycerol-3-phosphate transport system substrate-binding protein
MICLVRGKMFTAFVVGIAFRLAACKKQPGESRGGASNEVTIYVSTDCIFSEPILRAYEQKTGVKVNAVFVPITPTALRMPQLCSGLVFILCLCWLLKRRHVA